MNAKDGAIKLTPSAESTTPLRDRAIKLKCHQLTASISQSHKVNAVSLHNHAVFVMSLFSSVHVRLRLIVYWHGDVYCLFKEWMRIYLHFFPRVFCIFCVMLLLLQTYVGNINQENLLDGEEMNLKQQSFTGRMCCSSSWNGVAGILSVHLHLLVRKGNDCLINFHQVLYAICILQT